MAGNRELARKIYLKINEPGIKLEDISIPVIQEILDAGTKPKTKATPRMSDLVIALVEAKRMMHICKPWRECLGNQFYHWQAEKERILKQIKLLKTS